jgi:hypothetical protein
MPTSTSNGRWRWPSGTLPTAHLGAGRLGADVDDAAQANVQGVREELSSSRGGGFQRIVEHTLQGMVLKRDVSGCRTSDCETAAGSTTRWLTSSNPLRNFG